MTLNARVRAVGPKGQRWIDMNDLAVGYYQTALERDELITDVHVPAQPPGVCTAYAKFTALSADDWPTVGVAVWFRVEADQIAEARVAISAATERPVRVTAAEAILTGAPRRPRPSRRQPTPRPPASSRWQTSVAAPPTSAKWFAFTFVGRWHKRSPRAWRGTDVTTRQAEPLSATTSAPIEAPAEREPDHGRVGFREVGQSIPRLESAAKVNGSVEYIHNLRLPGMLHGRIHRSTVRARAHRPHRYRGCADRRGRARRNHCRRRPDTRSASVLRTRVSRPADPGPRQGPARR